MANPQKKVKCEFIKINNTANYINGQNVVIPWFEWDIERDNISDFDLITLDTRYGGEIKFRFKPYNGIKTLTINMNGVSQEEIRKRYTLIEEQDGYNLFTLTNITGEGYIYISGWDSE